MTGSTSTFSSQVHARLRADILGGRYAPGDALPSERNLSEELQTSRHVVREALKRLQQAGLVAISQGGATRVRDWRHHGGLELLLEGEVPESLNAARAAMEMRACIGADAARRAAQRADAAQRAQLVARAEQLAAVEDLAARNAHYEILWDEIVDGADNIAYRLALTTLVARQKIASIDTDAVKRELTDAEAIRALARAIADGEDEQAHARARELLERSI
ncbi:winged helix-turn-helix domain-containing protein [Solirubrobacter ginsenosidimutans]|uniref:Winged helix-turn-helix domain-containing protein n=1 Tax=Solirubrobacter ginsenosidimutans TaxID=490573 RepID=A0A9X3MPP9_9ACTN|nr:winged helix-turn-helix domain-containing protein [Solirubrobacter ginsenosidimutans]MDA0160566.1 winged helix-turn-helix domain-containing protein [Solirubrobacter ginsenosidimutans]